MPHNKLNLYLFQGEWYRFTLSSKPPRQAKGKVGGLRASVDNILIDLLNSSYPSYPSSFPGYLTRVVDFQIRSSIGCYNKTILIFNYFVFLLECYISFRSRCASLNKSEDGAYAFSKENDASCLAKHPSAAVSVEKRLPLAGYLHGLQFTFTFTVPYFSIGSSRSRVLL